MKIGLFTDSYPPYINGVSTSVENLRSALIKLGHTVYVVTVNDSLTNYNYNQNTKILRIPGIKTKIYNYRLSNVHSIKATKIIKSWNLDIIHSHTEFSIGIYARTIAKKYRIPLVHTYHTLYEDYTHYITHGHFDKLTKSFIKRFTKYYCEKTANHTIVPTDKIYKLFKEKYNINENVSIVPSGINIDKFLKESISSKEIEKLKNKFKIKKEDFVILFVGRLASEKNIEFLIESQKKILKKTKKPVKLLIVGDGPDKEKYITMARSINIYNNVIFTGSVSQDDVQNYYHIANIFATASNTETQGLTVIEAIASNLIPLCINDMAFTNFLPNECIFRDEEEYINKISSYIKNREKYQKNSKKLKEIINRYSCESYAINVLEIYNHVIKEYKMTMKVRDYEEE